MFTANTESLNYYLQKNKRLSPIRKQTEEAASTHAHRQAGDALLQPFTVRRAYGQLLLPHRQRTFLYHADPIQPDNVGTVHTHKLVGRQQLFQKLQAAQAEDGLIGMFAIDFHIIATAQYYRY